MKSIAAAQRLICRRFATQSASTKSYASSLKQSSFMGGIFHIASEAAAAAHTPLVFKEKPDSTNFSDSMKNLGPIYMRPALPDSLEHALWKPRLSSVLPSRSQLEKFIEVKGIQLSVSEIRKLVSILIDKFDETLPKRGGLNPDINGNPEAVRALSDVIQKDLPDLTPKDLVAIILKLWSHSTSGKQLAYALALVGIHRGNRDAEYERARMLLCGVSARIPIRPHQRICLAEIRKLAALRHGPALFFMAEFSSRQSGSTEFIQLIKMAAAAGHGPAMLNMGLWHTMRSGSPVQYNMTAAFNYFERAHKCGIAYATAMLGYFWMNGIGTPESKKNIPLAYELLEHAALRGDRSAQHNLGCLLIEAPAGIQRNITFGFEFWKMAAVADYPMSMINVAKAYMYGIKSDPSASDFYDPGIEPNYSHANSILEKLNDPSFKKSTEISNVAKQLMDDLLQLMQKS